MIKVSLIILAALAAAALLRKRSAAVRHWVLSAAIISAALTPVLEWVVPSWHVGFLTPRLTRPLGRPEQAVAVRVDRATNRVAPREVLPLELSDPVRPVDTRRLIGSLWVAGAGLSVLVLLVGLGRLVWLASRSERVLHGKWAYLAAELSRQFGLGRRTVLLLQSDHPTLLMTWGVRRPTIILPAGAREWSDDRMRIVLCHELAHVSRGDWLVQMVAALVRSMYWFNPLVWIACKRLRQESEHACDDAVLNVGVDGSEYATHLLDLARAVKAHRDMWMPAAAMARPSSLERRITAMLNTRLNRNPTTPPLRVATVIVVLGLTILVAGFGAAAQTAFATFVGSVTDPQDAFLPGVTLSLTNLQSQAKHEVRSDRTGRFEFVGLPPGDYSLETTLPGFATLRGRLTLAGQNVQQDLKLQIGSIQETLTVHETHGSPAPDPDTLHERLAAHHTDFRRVADDVRNLRRCGTPSNGTPIGGNIRVPRHENMVRPLYPQHLRGSGIDADVAISGRIGIDGLLNNLEVVGSAQPDFASAALDALREWEFAPTLLNCIPIEVPINVTVHFTHSQ